MLVVAYRRGDIVIEDDDQIAREAGADIAAKGGDVDDIPAGERFVFNDDRSNPELWD